ncbi:MAG TPA: hypothetical protein VK504_20490 [Vicinamibacterales bacterium]|jgi:hypothetical protein|nr:hypothetical protein [Vicinamibacterales bacterium]
MNRARCTFAATVVGVSFVSALLIAQTPAAPPMTSVLAGKKLTPPIRGQAEVDFTTPVTKRDKDMVITKIQVKNTSNAPIPRLTITETWYDAGGASVGGGKGAINGLLQPGEVQTIVIETPYNAKMKANNYNFSHANGTIKPHKVAKMGDEKEPAAKPASATKPAAKKK